MEFNTPLFLGFFAAAAVINYALPRMLRPYFLLIASYAFFLLWMLIPGLKVIFPNPVYPEWALAAIIFVLCIIFDKRPANRPEGDWEAIQKR